MMARADDFYQPSSPLAVLLRALGVEMAEIEALAPLVAPVAAEPTVSVIVRTQGRRPHTLLEAVESLAEQTRRRFDVIVTVHAEDNVVAERRCHARPCRTWGCASTKSCRCAKTGTCK